MGCPLGRKETALGEFFSSSSFLSHCFSPSFVQSCLETCLLTFSFPCLTRPGRGGARDRRRGHSSNLRLLGKLASCTEKQTTTPPPKKQVVYDSRPPCIIFAGVRRRSDAPFFLSQTKRRAKRSSKMISHGSDERPRLRTLLECQPLDVPTERGQDLATEPLAGCSVGPRVGPVPVFTAPDG